MRSYLEHLKAESKLSDFRLTRRKLGLGSPNVGEFHITMEFENLAQLDDTFSRVATRAEPVESFHHAVTSKVKDLSFALYRDFPDSVRQTGEERF